MSAWTSRRRALHFGNVRVHDHQSRAGLLLDQTGSGIVIAMSVADQEDLRVAVFETKLLDALSDRRHIFREIGVDEDVPLRRANQVNGEIGCPYIIEVA